MRRELAEVRAIVPLCLTGWLLLASPTWLCLPSTHKEINIHITYLLNVRVQSVFLLETTTSTGWGRFILINFPSFPTTGTFPVPHNVILFLVQYVPSLRYFVTYGEHSWRFGSSLSVATAANLLPKVVEEEGTIGPSRFSILFWRMT